MQTTCFQGPPGPGNPRPPVPTDHPPAVCSTLTLSWLLRKAAAPTWQPSCVSDLWGVIGYVSKMTDRDGKSNPKPRITYFTLNVWLLRSRYVTGIGLSLVGVGLSNATGCRRAYRHMLCRLSLIWSPTVPVWFVRLTRALALETVPL